MRSGEEARVGGPLTLPVAGSRVIRALGGDRGPLVPSPACVARFAPHRGPTAIARLTGGGPTCSYSAADARAARADSAEAVPGRRRSTHPSALCCRALATASAPGGTSSVITEPAAV